MGDAGGDGVDPGGDGDQLRLLGLLVGAQVVAGCLPGGAQLPGHGVGHGQGAGMVVGPRAALHAAPRRAHALRRHGPRRLRRPVLVPRRGVRRRPIPSGTSYGTCRRPCRRCLIGQLDHVRSLNRTVLVWEASILSVCR